jgi:hypothetical protein
MTRLLSWISDFDSISAKTVRTPPFRVKLEWLSSAAGLRRHLWAVDICPGPDLNPTGAGPSHHEEFNPGHDQGLAHGDHVLPHRHAAGSFKVLDRTHADAGASRNLLLLLLLLLLPLLDLLAAARSYGWTRTSLTATFTIFNDRLTSTPAVG